MVLGVGSGLGVRGNLGGSSDFGCVDFCDKMVKEEPASQVLDGLPLVMEELMLRHGSFAVRGTKEQEGKKTVTVTLWLLVEAGKMGADPCGFLDGPLGHKLRSGHGLSREGKRTGKPAFGRLQPPVPVLPTRFVALVRTGHSWTSSF